MSGKDFKPAPNSEEWARFEQWLEQELQVLYKRLASIGTSDEQTKHARGAVAFIHKLQALRAGPHNSRPD
jgi:hypothetical protein